MIGTQPGNTTFLRTSILQIVICGLVIFLLGFGTYSRNEIWKSDVAVWTDCVRKSPNKDRPHLLLGDIFVRQGRYPEAIGQFNEALRANPNYAEAHANLGAVFIFQGRYPEAIAEYSEALRIKPRYSEARYCLGVISIFQGKYQEAIAQLTEALRINPDYTLAHYSLGTAYLSVGNRDLVLKEYEVLKTKNPRLANALLEKIE